VPKADGIHIISENFAFAHPEADYDIQYGTESVEETIGSFVLDAAGFVPNRLLEIACGTGHMTASLVHDGRVKEIVASAASSAFLEITKRKVSHLPGGDKVVLLQLSDEDFDPKGSRNGETMRNG